MAPPEERRNYKNIFDAFIKITKEEGKFYKIFIKDLPSNGKEPLLQ